MRNKCSYFPSISSTPPRPPTYFTRPSPDDHYTTSVYAHTQYVCVTRIIHTRVFIYINYTRTCTFLLLLFLLLPLRGVMLAYTYVIYAYTYYIHYTNSQPPHRTRPRRSFENTFPSRNVMTQHRRPRHQPPRTMDRTRVYKATAVPENIMQHSTTPADIVLAVNYVCIYRYIYRVRRTDTI